MNEPTPAGGSAHIEVLENTADRFYELRVDGESAGLMVYELAGSRRIFTHTFIKEGYGGRGLSKRLMRDALDDLRAQHLKVTVLCPILEGFIAANPEYEVVIDPDHPGSWARHTPPGG
ncbi:MAG TPA: GNAT family N-acetyltransferase [Frankiaceae bacterium]|jgi:hypothetical protein|nr:GNAT family N-acetyltransferase [Frankiaceae bacterium]